MDFTSKTPQEIKDLANPAPEYAETIKSFKLVPEVDWADAPHALSKLRQMTSGVAFMGLHDPRVDEESLDVRTRDGAALELRVHRRAPTSPAEPTVPAPLVLLFHGGHHVLGFPGILAPTAATLAARFGAVVVSAAYRLAPEHPFPTGVRDAWDVLSWCAEHGASTLGADPAGAGFVIGGVSSGGSLAAVLAHQARDARLSPPVTGVWLACAGVRARRDSPARLAPAYRDRFLSRSQPECVGSPVLPAEMAAFMERQYAPDGDSELFAPLEWPTGHAGLPRTYLQVCGIDASRDENLIFDDMLKAEGVPTRLQLYAGLPHAFWGVLPNLPQSRRWREDTIEGFDWLLAKA